MSYDIDLCDPVSGATLELDEPHQMKGGTYCVGGTTEASLNVTWNYGKHFDFQSLNKISGAESIPVLESAIYRLGDKTDPDYWQPTEGNVKRALIQLLTLAKMRPDGAWKVD